MSEIDLDSVDFKYIRVGWQPQGRPCDTIVLAATRAMPGPALPTRWSWKSQQRFVNKFGHLGMVLWAQTASYHMLMLNGWHILRIWTDSSKTCIVDVCDNVALHFNTEAIPASCAKKCHPMTKRLRVTSVAEMEQVIAKVRAVYGV